MRTRKKRKKPTRPTQARHVSLTYMYFICVKSPLFLAIVILVTKIYF